MTTIHPFVEYSASTTPVPDSIPLGGLFSIMILIRLQIAFEQLSIRLIIDIDRFSFVQILSHSNFLIYV